MGKSASSTCRCTGVGSCPKDERRDLVAMVTLAWLASTRAGTFKDTAGGGGEGGSGLLSTEK